MNRCKKILQTTPNALLCVLGAIVFLLVFYTLAYRTPLTEVWMAPNIDNDEVIYNRQVVSIITHGGPQGFQNQVWESRIDGDAVEFLYYSEDGEMGYPGALKATARYDWSEENELRLTLTAESDAPTVVNLTNHTYFNLNGEGSGDILGHILQLNASEYIPTDDSLIPVGESEPVAGTPMDFVSPKAVGCDINADFPALKYGKGYDNCWVIDGAEPGQIQSAAILYSPESGRQLEVLTTQPGVQVYTGNWLAGCPVAKCGRSYNDYEGVAIECQHYPDSPNHPDYPSTVLRPGEIFEQAIIFAFSVR